MGNFVKWAEYDDSLAAEDEKRLAKQGASKWVKMNDGENLLRILPSLDPAVSPFMVVDEHRILLPGDKFAKAYACPGRSECAICTLVDRMYKASRANGDDSMGKAAGELRAKKRIYANVIDRNDEAAGPKRWSMSNDVFAQIQQLRSSRGGKLLLHPEKGRDLVVTKIPPRSPKNATDYAKFMVQTALDGSPLGDESQQEAWSASIPPLEDAVTQMTSSMSRDLAKQLNSGTQRQEPVREERPREIRAQLVQPKKPTKTIADDDEDNEDTDDIPF
jgi:hypothetical protein